MFLLMCDSQPKVIEELIKVYEAGKKKYEALSKQKTGESKPFESHVFLKEHEQGLAVASKAPIHDIMRAEWNHIKSDRTREDDCPSSCPSVLANTTESVWEEMYGLIGETPSISQENMQSALERCLNGTGGVGTCSTSRGSVSK
jgi:hypothetical protein